LPFQELLLPVLLRKLHEIKTLEWIRILYAYPSFVNAELIKTIVDLPKVCHYVDVPLQHISNPLLKSMKRGITTQQTRELVRRFRQDIPDIALRTSFIVGYPGETEWHFEELLQFMEEAKFERLGAFTYSCEEGTAAARMKNQVSESVKRKRFERVMELQQVISKSNTISPFLLSITI